MLKNHKSFILTILFSFFLFSYAFYLAFSNFDYNLSNITDKLFNRKVDVSVVNIEIPQQLSTQTDNYFLVCPTTSNKECNFYGSLGIQQAVDAAPASTPNKPFNIYIDQGTYKSDNLPQKTSDSGAIYSAFAHITDKNINFYGVPGSKTILDGASNKGASGFNVYGSSNIGIYSLSFVNFDTPYEYTPPRYNEYAVGLGIVAQDKSLVSLAGVYGSGNYYLVYSSSNSQLLASNILIKTLVQNGLSSGIYMASNSNSSVLNSTVAYSRTSGDAYSIHEDASLYIKNSLAYDIVTQEEDFDGKGFSYWDNSKLNVTHSLSFKNSHNFKGNSFLEFTNPTWSKEQTERDPLFTNYQAPNNLDVYNVAPNSPIIDGGDPSILDPDGSRSDIGAYGGTHACLLKTDIAGCDNYISKYWFPETKSSVKVPPPYFPAPNEVTTGLEGYFDGITQEDKAYGWVCKPSTPTTVFPVAIYASNIDPTQESCSTEPAFQSKQGETYCQIGALRSLEERTDLPGAGVCGGNPNHGFSLPIPEYLKDGKDHKLIALAYSQGHDISDKVGVILQGTKVTLDSTNSKPYIYNSNPKMNISEHDLNKDGKVDIKDVLYLLKVVFS
jgi:hypothetical protein